MEVSLGTLPSEIQEPVEDGQEIPGGVRGDIRRTWPTESNKQGSHGLKETEMSSVGPACICIKSSVHMLWLLACCACENPNSRSRCISDSCLLQQLFSSYWTAVWSLDRRTLFCLIVTCFVLSSCHFLETCSFLKRRSWGN